MSMNVEYTTAAVINCVTTLRVHSAADVTPATSWNMIDELVPVSLLVYH